MTILRRQLGETAKDWNQDWWELCYDDVRRFFYVEHRWHHVDERSVAIPPYQGNEHISIGSFNGPGWWLIDDFEDELLEEAGHD